MGHPAADITEGERHKKGCEFVCPHSSSHVHVHVVFPVVQCNDSLFNGVYCMRYTLHFPGFTLLVEYTIMSPAMCGASESIIKNHKNRITMCSSALLLLKWF